MAKNDKKWKMAKKNGKKMVKNGTQKKWEKIGNWQKSQKSK
jgi:hypothetical protein